MKFLRKIYQWWVDYWYDPSEDAGTAEYESPYDWGDKD